MKKILVSQRGDTLIEVTIALAILAVVLLSATVVTTRAFRLGQTARERTEISEAAQVQAEALRSFRDNHTWAEFLNGGSIAGVAYNGVLNGNAGGPVACKVVSPCMHMAPKTFSPTQSEYIPTGGAVVGVVSTSYIEITAVPTTPAPVKSVDVTISYGFTEIGGTVQTTGHIKTTLTDIGLKP